MVPFLLNKKPQIGSFAGTLKLNKDGKSTYETENKPPVITVKTKPSKEKPNAPITA